MSSIYNHKYLPARETNREQAWGIRSTQYNWKAKHLFVRHSHSSLWTFVIIQVHNGVHLPYFVNCSKSFKFKKSQCTNLRPHLIWKITPRITSQTKYWSWGQMPVLCNFNFNFEIYSWYMIPTLLSKRREFQKFLCSNSKYKFKKLCP